MPCCFALSRHPQDHQGITHLAGSLALRPLHHLPHFTICSVACVPPPLILWTATHCSLIPGDTVPIILFSFDLTAFTAAACYHTYGLPPLLQHHTSFIPASYQPHTSLMPLCFTSCATNCHDHELHKRNSVEEVTRFLLLLLLIIFVLNATTFMACMPVTGLPVCFC